MGILVQCSGALDKSTSYIEETALYNNKPLTSWIEHEKYARLRIATLCIECVAYDAAIASCVNVMKTPSPFG